MRKPPKEKKPVSVAQKKASLQNLKIAQEKKRILDAKRKIAEMNEEIKQMPARIDDAIETKIEEKIKDMVDRDQLKNDVLQIFYELGGKRWLKKFAKEEPKSYLALMKEILKYDKDSKNTGGGVVININGGRGRFEKNVTPNATPTVIDIGN
jgi:hypothetical protein